jgi:hypothetical protein
LIIYHHNYPANIAQLSCSYHATITHHTTVTQQSHNSHTQQSHTITTIYPTTIYPTTIYPTTITQPSHNYHKALLTLSFPLLPSSPSLLSTFFAKAFLQEKFDNEFGFNELILKYAKKIKTHEYTRVVKSLPHKITKKTKSLPHKMYGVCCVL